MKTIKHKNGYTMFNDEAVQTNAEVDKFTLQNDRYDNMKNDWHADRAPVSSYPNER